MEAALARTCQHANVGSMECLCSRSGSIHSGSIHPGSMECPFSFDGKGDCAMLPLRNQNI
jgi:hypothetical protein